MIMMIVIMMMTSMMMILLQLVAATFSFSVYTYTCTGSLAVPTFYLATASYMYGKSHNTHTIGVPGGAVGARAPPRAEKKCWA